MCPISSANTGSCVACILCFMNEAEELSNGAQNRSDHPIAKIEGELSSKAAGVKSRGKELWKRDVTQKSLGNYWRTS